MKLRLLALLTILLLALTACSNEDNTGGNGGSDIKLSDRVGTYKAIIVIEANDMTAYQHAIVKVESTKILVNVVTDENINYVVEAQPTKETFSPDETKTSFEISTTDRNDMYAIEFKPKSTDDLILQGSKFNSGNSATLKKEK